MTKREARIHSKSELVEIINRLERLAAEQQMLIEELKARNTELESRNARLRKDSSTSSKPPSSDLIKPPGTTKRGKKGNGRPGAKPGHPRHERQEFSAEVVDEVVDHVLDHCPGCDGPLQPSRRDPTRVQQVDLRERPIVITEHRAHAAWCPQCRTVHYATIPGEIRRAGLVGPRLTALVGFLKGSCHASYTAIAELLADVFGLPLSRGFLAKLVQKVSRALQPTYDDLLDRLIREPLVNVDETGHKERGKKLWTWCFRAGLFTLYRIRPSRGSDVLLETLGREFNGLLGCDYFSSYRKFMRRAPDVLVQFCLAHLIRDLRFLQTLPHRGTRTYGERMLRIVRRLFRTIYRRETMTSSRFERALVRVRKNLLHVATHPPHTSEALAIADRFRAHGEDYLRFLTTPGLEPTNNLAEQALRFVVIDRKITQGTRSAKGRRWSERIWSVRMSCKQQRRSIYQFVLEALQALLARQPAPSLLP